MNIKKTFSLIHSDYKRYLRQDYPSFLRVVFFAQGFWASTIYRLSYWAKYDLNVPFFRPVIRGLLALFEKFIEIITGIGIPVTCKIGEGLYIAHFGPIVFTGMAEVGKNCFISHYVTLGWKPSGKYAGVPKIGDRVFIGPHSIVLGGVTIGNDVLIGAGSVVTRSFPDRSVVAGNPAKLIASTGSFEIVKYENMDNDQDRQESLKRLEDIIE